MNNLKGDRATAVLKAVSVLFVAILSFGSALAQGEKYISHNFKNNVLSVKTDESRLAIRFLSPSIVEVVAKLDEPERPSHAVVMRATENMKPQLVDSEVALQLVSDGMRVHINKEPFSISYYYEGRQLLQERRGFFADSLYSGFSFGLEGDETLYGAGERSVPMSRRGYRFELYNKAHYAYGEGSELMNYGLPLVLSSKNYAVLFDNGAKGYIDMAKTEANTLEFGAVGGRMAYYVVAGDDFPDLVNKYGRLTGTQPMPPRWALGNIQSRFGYKTQGEVLNTMNQMIEEDFPLDGVVLDLFWFGPDVKGYMGDLAWDYEKWPEPKMMIDSLKGMGVNTVLITEPFVLTNTKNFQIGDSLRIFALDTLGLSATYDFFFGNTALIDIFKPSAQDWFWEQYDRQNKIGVAGWWGDLGEPEVHPSWVRHVNGTADEVHNIYAHFWEKMVFEKYAQEYPDKRVFHLNRSGFAGSQRYSIFPWSGDVGRNWSGLKAQMPILLTMSMSGIPYMSSDIGGFAGGEKDGELYTRWAQFGVFNPVYRPHADALGDIPAEPIFFDKRTKDIVRKYVKLRYELMPYLYTMAWQALEHGMPLARPMFFQEPDNDKLKALDQQYYWGNDMVVAPVLDKGAKSVKVYLPTGGEWFNLITSERFKGGEYIDYGVDLDKFPVFVRAGAVIPTVENYYSANRYSSEELKLKLFCPEKKTSVTGRMYEDDGVTKDAYARRKSEMLDFSGEVDSKCLSLNLDRDVAGKYDSMPENRTVTVEAIGFSKKPKRVLVNGKKVKAVDGVSELDNVKDGFYWDSTSGKLFVRFRWEGVSEASVLVK
ncbi:alpha-glucosidase [Fulvitalea axinellae]|uniref:Alpha-glucosidase n=2 Tax=Fulvitalea axinellae TaxID=1182444 RepID=A0AAU9CPU8_9BACT|nr:alpha-glucosidase [Fulvitalea axinellae]